MNIFLSLSRLRSICVAASLITFSTAGVASATPYNHFSLDLANSSVTVGSSYCWPNCAISSSINSSVATSPDSLDFSLNSLNDSLNVPNLIEWAISGTGVGAFTMALDLVFTAPDAQSGTSSGSGYIGTFWGVLTAGIIQWSNPIVPITFDNGSALNVELHDGVYIASDPYNWGGPGVIQSGVTFTPTMLAGLDTPSPVPLPAALPALLLMILGALGVGRFRRRRSAETALPV